MTAVEKLLSAHVGHLMATGRSSELSTIFKETKRGATRKERAKLLIAAARARYRHIAIRYGLPPLRPIQAQEDA